MMGRLDFLVAFGLAAGVHVAGFGYFAATGEFEGTGAEGRAALSLQAASPGAADLVAEWEAVPEVSQVSQTLEAPVSEPTFTKVNVWSDAPVDVSVSKLGEGPEILTAPVVSAARSPVLAAVQVPASRAPDVGRDIEIARVIAPAMPEAPPSAPAFEAPEEAVTAALTTPRPIARPVRRETAPTAAIVARGTGGGVSAGNLGATQVVATLSPAARQAAQAAWASKIQSRIARHQSYPRGARGEGRVRLQMDILADGRLGGVRIDRSSGVAAFDKAALRAAEAAAPFPPAPDGLQRARYAFAQWVNFSR